MVVPTTGVVFARSSSEAYSIGFRDGCRGVFAPGPHTNAYLQLQLPATPPSLTTQQDSHYQIGYNDGCAGRVVPGHHTSEYERGYADGQAAPNTQT